MSQINPELWEQAEKLAKQPYLIEISEDKLSSGERVFLVKNPELQGCMAQGASPSEAIQELHEARKDFIYFLLEDGLEVPAPRVLHTTTRTGMNMAKIALTESSNPSKNSVGSLNIDDENALDDKIQEEDNEKPTRVSVIAGNLSQT
jgi:predicted RNase H-like HicB family nuclease